MVLEHDGHTGRGEYCIVAIFRKYKIVHQHKKHYSKNYHKSRKSGFNYFKEDKYQWC